MTGVTALMPDSTLGENIQMYSSYYLEKMPPTPFKVEAIKTRVVEKLPDPDSAQFRKVRSVWNEKLQRYYVCGEVNFKNDFGAYSGYREFYAEVNENYSYINEAGISVTKVYCGN